MKKKLIIFGGGDLAELAHYYFSTDSDYDVVAFTLDDNFIDKDTLCGLPVCPFSELSTRYPHEDYDAFIALSYSGLNKLRKEKYNQMKGMGYYLTSYISSYAYVANNVKIGRNCFILENNTIQPFVKIDSNCTIWSGNHIGHHSRIYEHNFIASHVVRSGGVKIEAECFIGVNATLRDHITIGSQCVIGAGAIILSDAEAGGVYIGAKTNRSKIPSSRLKTI